MSWSVLVNIFLYYLIFYAMICVIIYCFIFIQRKTFRNCITILRVVIAPKPYFYFSFSVFYLQNNILVPNSNMYAANINWQYTEIFLDFKKLYRIWHSSHSTSAYCDAMPEFRRKVSLKLFVIQRCAVIMFRESFKTSL